MTFDRRTVLAFMITGAFIVVILLLLLYPPNEINETVKNLLLVLLGIMGGQVNQVFSFDFGSSAGSKAKDDALIAAAETPQAAARRVSEQAATNTEPLLVTVKEQEIKADVKADTGERT
jgi:hypothetical protein